MSSGHFLSTLFAIFHPPTSSHHHHSLTYSIIDLDFYEQCYELMWLQQCIKDTCIAHIRTRASLTRDSSHCLSIVSKLFVSGITSERTWLPSNLLDSPLKECNIYVSADLRTIQTNGWFYIEHTFHYIHHFLLPWSFYSFQNKPFVKRLHILSVDTRDFYLQLLSATLRPKPIPHPTTRHLFPQQGHIIEILTGESRENFRECTRRYASTGYSTGCTW